MVVREILKEDDRQVRGLRLGRGRILFDPVLDNGVMRLGPGVDVSAMRRIAGDPVLRDRVVRIRPLRDDVRIAAELVGLEPGFDVGRDRLPLLVARGVGRDRTDRPGDAVAQRIVRRRIAGRRRGGRIVGGGRRTRLEILVLGERLGDQHRADHLAVRGPDDAAVRLEREQGLADHPEYAGIDAADDDDADGDEHEALGEIAQHRSSPEKNYATRRRATMTRSIALMPMNGTITPPRPQISRLRRNSASAPSARYFTPLSAIGMSSGMISALKSPIRSPDATPP